MRGGQTANNEAYQTGLILGGIGRLIEIVSWIMALAASGSGQLRLVYGGLDPGLIVS